MADHVRTHRRAAALLVTASILLVAAACSSGSSDAGSSVGPGAGTVGSSEPDASAATLEDLALSEDDLLDGEQAVVPADSDTVSDSSPTMDFCQMPIPSEADREARHRIQIASSDLAPIATSEAVRYAPSTAVAAMTDIRGAFIDCPEDEPVDIGEGELITYDAMPIFEGDLAELTSDHVGADITATTTDGEVTETTMIFQRRGDVIIATIGDDHDRVLALAIAAGRRLDSAPADAIGD